MKLLILGAGGFGRTVADLAAQLNCYDRIAFLDDHQTGEGILGKCGDFPQFADADTHMYPAFGNNSLRLHWLKSLRDASVTIPTLIHPKAYVSPGAKLGAGVMVLPLAAVSTGAVIGDGCILNLGAILDHDCVLEEGAHLAPGAIVKAGNHIPAMGKVESGAVIEARSLSITTEIKEE